MDISEKVTKQEFQKLLLYTYNRVEKSEKLEIKDLINEIKLKIVEIVASRRSI